MSARWKKLGAKAADVPYCNAFSARAAQWGWSPAEIDRAVEFGLKHQTEGWDRFEPLAIHYVHSQGLADKGFSDTDLDQALGWVETVRQTPAIREALDAQSYVETFNDRSGTATGSEGRIKEIEKVMREDAHRYWGDPAMLKEYEALITARENARQSEPVRMPTAAEKRLGEIQQAMQTDMHAYYRDEAMQAEHFALIEAQMPAQEASEP
jgi:hypothetical protein